MPITWVTVKGRRTRVAAEGDADRPPILLLHGIGRTLEDWQPQFSRYRNAGYRVIAPDMPGAGFSDRLPTQTTLHGLALGVAETLDAIGEFRHLHLMGNSLGGAVAMQLLALQPDRVATLVLDASAGFGSSVHPLLRVLATPVVGGIAARYTSPASARMAERLLYVDQSLVTKQRIDLALKVGRQSDSGAVLYETSRSLGTIRGVRSEWRRRLMTDVAKHPRPTLIAWGDRDRILPSSQIKAAQELLPHAQVHLFRGVGHMPQVEVADDFATVTLNFLHSQDLP